MHRLRFIGGEGAGVGNVSAVLWAALVRIAGVLVCADLLVHSRDELMDAVEASLSRSLEVPKVFSARALPGSIAASS